MVRFFVLLFLVACLPSLAVKAQELKVNGIALVDGDNSAADNPRYDNNKQPCAMLKVYINDMPDLMFNSSMVIDKENIKYVGGYYAVYVASGIRKLEIRHRDFAPVTIKFKEDYGVSVKGGKTYRVDLATEGVAMKHTQTVVFDMRPRKGNIIVDNQSHAVDEGVLQLELLPGEHAYTATGEYYRDSTGCVTVADVSESQVVKLRLKPRMAYVNFICNVADATLYVDNINKGEPGNKLLPLGKHKIRVVAKDCIDHTDNVLIDSESGFELNVRMQPKSVISVVIEATGFTSPSLFIDNKAVPSWVNGNEIKVKRGKHLITISDERSTKERVVDIQQNMGVIKISK